MVTRKSVDGRTGRGRLLLSRREFLRTTGAATAAGMLGPLLWADDAGNARRRRPNIVLFLSDDHGWLDSGCYGNKVVETPNIDRLAKEGMRFTRAFTTSPTCTPSRCSLLTGLYPHRNGAHPNHSTMRARVKTLPSYFADIGYRVVHEGKTHVMPQKAFPWESRWDNRRPSVRRIDALLADPGDKPLFLYVASREPHVPWTKRPAYDPAAATVPPYLEDTPRTRGSLVRYYTDVRNCDRELGRVLALLEKHKMTDNTIVFYTSDNGAQFRHAKWELYDAGIRMPFVVRWPGRVKPGTVTDAMVSFVDMLPTLMAAAGGRPPADIDGRNFLGVLEEKTEKHRDAIFATHTGDVKPTRRLNYFPMRALRTDTHKYILNLVTKNTAFIRDRRVAKQINGEWVWPEEELYDLRVDPHELKNIADGPAHQATRVALRKRLLDICRQQGDTLEVE